MSGGVSFGGFGGGNEDNPTYTGMKVLYILIES
jgi:hypothetical protein